MRVWAGAVSAALLVFSFAPANAEELEAPDGLWEIQSGDSRYQVTTCGSAGQLCGKLVWLGGGSNNAENRSYLNTMLIDEAQKIGAGRWKGRLSLFGQTGSGTISQFTDDQIEIRGCVLFIACKSYYLHRMP
jgi:hypothetical protein